ncbi:universal stress protein [Streptomyces triticisoli]|jgi:nucleotide-binding universal stress UspA family protein|uniref:universal stress protein n=1 Tax=Streptomyces triticisoli TaxID=2182797 RepID=UPI000DDA9064|nr:universal stress protein [Streptomyces triticisoli]
MELPLVVGVDGSDPSLTAVDWAVDEAARHGRSLRLVYASLWERYEGAVPSGSAERPSEQVMAEHIVASSAERAQRRNADVKVSTDILPEDAVSALLDEGNTASALVVGSRGRGGLKGLLLGSVSLAVAARAHCPVVVVRGDKAGLAGTHERILLGAGEPDTGGEAVRFAFREAEARGCVLDVVRAWRSPAFQASSDDPARGHEERALGLLEDLLGEARAEHPDVRLRPATVEGPAHRVLVDRSAAADLVIVGARHRTGRSGLQLGRTAHALLHHAQCPVAVVPQRV